ncbi:MAG: TlyA family RNA methyltransferase [Hyphomicrobiaceae bacterium]|nr:TlyA family RNA methyltransferase [Hyphomicrobiaceae bacterium]
MRLRLDQLLLARGLVQSRARAADLIKRGAVVVDGALGSKPGQLVRDGADVAIEPAANAHVARSGAKLVAALRHFGLSPAGLAALDVGASTGGFTQVLLEAGARHVYAVDVGHGQLHADVRSDPRVTNLEGLDARALTPADVPEPIGAIVADVSFIGLARALPVPLTLAAPACWLVALVKPQFEAGRGAADKRGVIRDAETREQAVVAVEQWLQSVGWRSLGHIPSPLPGKEGNIEYLVGSLRRDG